MGFMLFFLSNENNCIVSSLLGRCLLHLLVRVDYALPIISNKGKRKQSHLNQYWREEGEEDGETGGHLR